MKTLFLTLLFSSLTILHSEEKNYMAEFYKDFDKISAKYRKGFSESILAADRVTIHLVKFDSGNKIDLYSDLLDDTEGKIVVSPYESHVETISSKTLGKKGREQFLKLFSSQVSLETAPGEVGCHFPIHGVKVYKDDQIIYQGTFCWVCYNFGISYPVGSAWLLASKELEAFFNKHLPIPKEELDRFYKKWPSVESKDAGMKGEVQK